MTENPGSTSLRPVRLRSAPHAVAITAVVDPAVAVMRVVDQVRAAYHPANDASYNRAGGPAMTAPVPAPMATPSSVPARVTNGIAVRATARTPVLRIERMRNLLGSTQWMGAGARFISKKRRFIGYFFKYTK